MCVSSWPQKSPFLHIARKAIKYQPECKNKLWQVSCWFNLREDIVPATIFTKKGKTKVLFFICRGSSLAQAGIWATASKSTTHVINGLFWWHLVSKNRWKRFVRTRQHTLIWKRDERKSIKYCDHLWCNF